jgi:two-component system phosphate regulon sensor histidine kinase PhoR
MIRRRLFWHVFPPHLVLILVALVVVTWFSSHTLRSFWLESVEHDLELRARLIATFLASEGPGDEQALALRVREALGAPSTMRLTLVAVDGRVLGDSEKDPAGMGFHGDRPEIQEALMGNRGISTRFSRTLQKNLMYVAVPLKNETGIAGAVRVSVPITFIEQALSGMYINIALTCLGVALLASLVGLAIARKITDPLMILRTGAERFASGDLNHKLPLPDALETAALADAMNQMAEQLSERMQTIASQAHEQEAVLSSMLEGVLAVDSHFRVITMNRAAMKLLKIKEDQHSKRTIQELVRNAELQEFIEAVIAGQTSLEREIELYEKGRRLVRLRGAVLRDTQLTGIGAVVVLNDVTHVRRLEHMRSDFVANVSHELRTPITSIKGFVETLMDSNLEDKEEAHHFLSIVAKQSDRLNAIIEDLLSLSRLEEEGRAGRVELEDIEIKGLLESAIQDCQVKTREKTITVRLESDENLYAQVNPHLFEQVIVNLLDNALKYSQASSEVRVEARQESDTIRISIQDWGCGIAEEHLPRLFERFYRVDKARSRDMGGTGLGLAIVKHITQVHGGRVTVESTLGKGSTFSLYLPNR